MLFLHHLLHLLLTLVTDIAPDDALRELLARYSSSQGFAAREAGNGKDGLALALGQACDIVALDHPPRGQPVTVADPYRVAGVCD